MTNVYTLVCYRANGVDTCRGCVMERSDSEFEIFSHTNQERIIERWADKMFQDDTLPAYTAVQGWEVSLLINGYEEYNHWDLDEQTSEQYSKITDEIKTAAQKLAKTLVENYQQQKLREEQDKLAKQLASKEAAELQEFERLKQKFKNPT